MKTGVLNIIMVIQVVVLANTSELSLSLFERLVFCGVFAAVCGLISSGRGNNKMKTRIQISLECGVGGLILALATDSFVDNNTSRALLVLAACGVIGLGGRPAVDTVKNMGINIVLRNLSLDIGTALNLVR